MAQNITITLTDTEYKAMEVIAYSPQEWVENVTKVRAQKAINSIAEGIIKETLAGGGSISGTNEEIVANATLETAKQRTDAEDSTTNP
jgi:hypothetical protein